MTDPKMHWESGPHPEGGSMHVINYDAVAAGIHEKEGGAWRVVLYVGRQPQWHHDFPTGSDVHLDGLKLTMISAIHKVLHNIQEDLALHLQAQGAKRGMRCQCGGTLEFHITATPDQPNLGKHELSCPSCGNRTGACQTPEEALEAAAAWCKSEG